MKMNEDTFFALIAIAVIGLAGVTVGYVYKDTSTPEPITIERTNGQITVSGYGYVNLANPKIEYVTLDLDLTEKECTDWLYGSFSYRANEVIDWTLVNNDGYCEITSESPNNVEFKCKQKNDSELCNNQTQFNFGKQVFLHMTINEDDYCMEEITTYHTFYVKHANSEKWCRGENNNIAHSCVNGKIITEDCGRQTCLNGQCM